MKSLEKIQEKIINQKIQMNSPESKVKPDELESFRQEILKDLSQLKSSIQRGYRFSGEFPQDEGSGAGNDENILDQNYIEVADLPTLEDPSHTDEYLETDKEEKDTNQSSQDKFNYIDKIKDGMRIPKKILPESNSFSIAGLHNHQLNTSHSTISVMSGDTEDENYNNIASPP
eukprot:UN31469